MPGKTLLDLERKYGGFGPPAFEIDIDGGGTFSPAEDPASSVKVQTSIDQINRVTFSVTDVYDQASGDFTGLSDKGLSVGNRLEVSLGYGSTTETVMIGEITNVKPTFPTGDVPTVDVVGHDYRWAMDRASSDRSWSESTVEAASASIAEGYGFDSVEVGGGGPSGGSELELKRLVKDAESDLAFLQALASTFDYEVFSDAGTLQFRRPASGGTPTVSLGYGRGLQSFRPTGRSGQSMAKSVEHRGVDHYTGKSLSGSSQRSEGADGTLIRKAAMESGAEADRRSSAVSTALDRERESELTSVGIPDLRIGEWLELSGLGSVDGDTYDGVYYLQAVDHTMDHSGYTTRATVIGPRNQ